MYKIYHQCNTALHNSKILKPQFTSGAAWRWKGWREGRQGHEGGG